MESKRNFFQPIIVMVVLLAIYVPVTAGAMYTSDFENHTRFALELKETGDLSAIPHFLYHVLLLTVRELLPQASPQLWAAVPTLVSYMLVGVFIYALLRKEFEAFFPFWIILGATLGILFVGAISYPLDGERYVESYINPTSYYNPTQILVKVFVLPVFLFALYAVDPNSDKQDKLSLRLIMLSGILVILMTLSKPNYTLALIPGLGLFTLYRLITHSEVNWRLLLGGLAFPAFSVLLFQFIVSFGADEDSSIAIGFLTAARATIDVWRLPFQLILSVLLPIAIYIFYFQDARKSVALNLSWIILFVGLIYTYFFYEDGPRFINRNFYWGAYTCLFVLMYHSVVFFLHQSKEEIVNVQQQFSNVTSLSMRFIAINAIWLLHIMSGVIYYLRYAVPSLTVF